MNFEQFDYSEIRKLHKNLKLRLINELISHQDDVKYPIIIDVKYCKYKLNNWNEYQFLLQALRTTKVIETKLTSMLLKYIKCCSGFNGNLNDFIEDIHIDPEYKFNFDASDYNHVIKDIFEQLSLVTIKLKICNRIQKLYFHPDTIKSINNISNVTITLGK